MNARTRRITSPPTGARDAIARHPWLFLVAASVVTLVVQLPWRHATSWHYFADAAHLLFSPPVAGPEGGLDVFATHPEFQFGPLAVLAAAPFAYLPPSVGIIAVMLAGSALGVVAVAAIADMTRRVAPDERRATFRRRLTFGALPLVLVWSDISARTAHLDDAIALTATACALSATSRRRPWLATAVLAIAAAAKPWGIVFAPIALAVPGPRRNLRLPMIATFVSLTWLPFVIDEPSTLRAAGSFKIANAASSALRVLGATDALTPGWVRPAQIIGGLLIASLLVRRGQWHSVVMAGLAFRLMLDPGVHHYYAAGLTLGVLVWELNVRQAHLPVATVTTAILLEATSSAIQPASLAGALRLALTTSLIIAAFVKPIRPGRNSRKQQDGTNEHGIVAGPVTSSSQAALRLAARGF